jgi:hypothetical protein
MKISLITDQKKVYLIGPMDRITTLDVNSCYECNDL